MTTPDTQTSPYKLFNPYELQARLLQQSGEAASGVDKRARSTRPLVADRSDCLTYVYHNNQDGKDGKDDKNRGMDMVLAINVALATKRPLLVSGRPGSGKSSLACSIARLQGWRYYEQVITSRTSAQDLLWHFDTLNRLRDAQAQQDVSDPTPYIEPGVMWWAIDRESAARRGAPKDRPVANRATDPDEQTAHSRAVVLLDEIDKADPDVPNNLLVPLGSFKFTVTEGNSQCQVEANERNWPLVVITTNGERELPAAFLRRCIPLRIAPPSAARLEEIARRRFNSLWGNAYDSWYKTIAEIVAPPPKDGEPQQATASTAEFLDAVIAAVTLNIEANPENPRWKELQDNTIFKPTRTVEAG